MTKCDRTWLTKTILVGGARHRETLNGLVNGEKSGRQCHLSDNAPVSSWGRLEHRSHRQKCHLDASGRHSRGLEPLLRPALPCPWGRKRPPLEPPGSASRAPCPHGSLDMARESALRLWKSVKVPHVRTNTGGSPALAVVGVSPRFCARGGRQGRPR